MNILKRIEVNCIHFKLLYFGDKEFKNKGYKFIPCIECGNRFLSHMHLHDNYDSVCRECLKKYKE